MQVKNSQNHIITAALILSLVLAAVIPSYAAQVSAVTRLELNYEEAVVVIVGEDPVPRVSVRALDAAGDPVHLAKITAEAEDASLAEVTAYNAITDKNGYSSFSVDGKAEGDTLITFKAAGGAASVTIPLLVRAAGNRTARPVARIGGTVFGADAPKANTVTVPAGSELELDCGTDGALIFYNMNDTCPCQDLVSRKPYTGPITVTADSYFRITAYKPGLEYSPRLNITVNVYVPGDVNGDKRILADDARLALRASADLEALGSLQILCADVNHDNRVLADDARLILRASAGLEELWT